MSTYIPENLRLLTAKRANYACEYCLLSQGDAFHSFHIDHIISLKHGGPTIENNLAFACSFCNRNKGSDVGSYLFSKEQFVRFFNPRKDKWVNHFSLDLSAGLILPKTEVGEATIKILIFNNSELVIDRKMLIQAGTYPAVLNSP